MYHDSFDEYKSDDEIIDVADLCCIYLSHDEPKKEEFWIKVKNIVPWAKRVDGVKGIDNAHKAAAALSSTERFVLIDGDNIPDPAFFNLQLRIEDWQKDCVFRWKARNEINGLCYGNGGLSLWTKKFVETMRTHENSDGSPENNIEFCFHKDYIAMNDCYSTTYPGQSEYHAFRAGFREGVKMCLNRGVKPTMQEFEQQVHLRNLDNLSIWLTVGSDTEFGIYAIYGSQYGVYKTMLTEWDYTEVHNYEKLTEIWNEWQENQQDDLGYWQSLLTKRLGLLTMHLHPMHSEFFKYHYIKAQKNLGAMRTEMSVIRQVEGW